MRTPDDLIGSIYSLMLRGFYLTAFQPIADPDSGQAIGYESLLRGPEDTPLADPGRLFNEVGYLPESVRLKLDRACIDSAVRTGRNLPSDALPFINILGSTHIQLTTLRRRGRPGLRAVRPPRASTRCARRRRRSRGRSARRRGQRRHPAILR